MKIWFTMIIILLSFNKAFAQTWVEQRAFISQGRLTLRMSTLINTVNTDTGKKMGGFAWLQTEKTLGKKKKDYGHYGQGYAGVTYYFWPWMQVAAGVGLEDAENPDRAGGYVWVGNKSRSILFVPEYGGSGFWWKLEANRKISKAVGLGFITERFKGSGLRAEYRIPKTQLTIWAAPMFDRNSVTRKFRSNALFGIRWTL